MIKEDSKILLNFINKYSDIDGKECISNLSEKILNNIFNDKIDCNNKILKTKTYKIQNSKKKDLPKIVQFYNYLINKTNYINHDYISKIIKEYANDLWIKTQIRALTAKNAGLSSLAYNFEVIKGKVYMAGITSDKEELDVIIQTIKGVKGVKELVNYIIVKD